MMTGLESENEYGNASKMSRWLPVVLWLALIFTLSSIPLNGRIIVKLFRHQDKLIHFLEYGILGALLVRAVYDHGLGMARYWACIGLAVAVGAIDEVHQSFIPGRMMDWHDLLADTAGALLFAWLWLAYKASGLTGIFRTSSESES